MANVDRKPDETRLDYIKRLVYGKLKDKTLSDVDYTELSPLIFGEQYASDETRKRMYGAKTVLEVLDQQRREDIKDESEIKQLDAKIAEMQIEKQKFFDMRTAYNRMCREEARRQEMVTLITDAVSSGWLPELSSNDIRPNFVSSGNDLLVSLNDIHYGAEIDNAWCKYNSDICKEMMSNYAAKILEIAEVHDVENLIITCAGDSISGNIHYTVAMENKENVIQQVMGVAELIAQFINVLRPSFKTVRYISIAGNHSRLDPNKNTALKDERLDDLVEWYLKARLQNCDNVIIDTDARLDSTLAVFEARTKNYALVHGDYDGSAGKIQSLQTMSGVPLYCVLSGHLHHNATNEVQGIKTIMGGSFLGMDSYCVAKRIYGHPSQMVTVINDNGVLCNYDIDLQIH